MNDQLPSPGEPFILADGTKIDPSNGKPIKEHRQNLVEIPNYREAKESITAAKRKLSDIPTPPKQLHTMAVVTFYELLGVTKFEIAVATGLSEDQIARVQEQEAYKQYRSDIVNGLLSQTQEDMNALFQQHSKGAFHKVVDLMESEDEKVGLAASKDILDRAGYRPVDVVEQRVKMEGGLKIEFINRSTDEMPTAMLDITPDEEED